MAFQDCYELVDVSTWYGQEVLNVYFYQQNNALNPGVTASDVVDGYLATVLPALLPLQVSGVVHTEIRCRNLFNPADNHIRAISEAGTNLGTDGTNAFDAISFTLVQDNGAVRNGRKRYAGAAEDFATNGVVDNAGAITLLNALGDALIEHFFILAADIFRPVVLKRVLDGGEYRLPASLGEAVIGMVTDAVWQALVTSQVSRKIGDGV